MSTLITGMSGFIGGHLATLLSGTEAEPIWGTVRRGRTPGAGGVRWARGDLTHADWILSLVRRVRPRTCLHLAGQSRERASWRDPWCSYETNLRGQLNLLEALRRCAPDCRVLIASSSAVYGFMQGNAMDEAHPLTPVSPYGISKLAQDLMGQQYARAAGLPVLISRTFNIIGPGQSDQFALSSFAHQIARMEAGLQPPRLAVGNLEVERDFLDVRDLARAWRLILTQGQPGEVYNVGRGQTHRLREVVQVLMDLAHVSLTVEESRARLRPSPVDPPVLRADIGKLRRLGDWSPTVPLERTLEDLLQYWRTQMTRRRAADPARETSIDRNVP